MNEENKKLPSEEEIANIIDAAILKEETTLEKKAYRRAYVKHHREAIRAITRKSFSKYWEANRHRINEQRRGNDKILKRAKIYRDAKKLYANLPVADQLVTSWLTFLHAYQEKQKKHGKEKRKKTDNASGREST